MRTRNTMRQNKGLVLACVAVVLLSILFRLHAFSPSIISGEWHSATVLRHLDSWNNDGPWKFAFNPVVTYSVGANKFIDNNASNQEDRLAYTDSDENYYYTSYPQFGYIAPYLFFKVLFTDPSIVGLRIFGMLVQVGTAILLFKILHHVTRQKSVGFVGFAAYMLMPITLHYHADNYMSDMLVPLFFVSSVYLFLRIVLDESRSRLIAVLFILSIALMIYTEYLGLFVAGVMLLYGLFNRKEKFARLIIWTCTLVPAATMFWIAGQYAMVGSLDSFLAVMVDRYANSYTPYTNFSAVMQIVSQYWRWYLPVIVVILSLLLVRWLISLAAKQEEPNVGGYEKRGVHLVLLVSVLPVVIHHAVLLHWTAFHAPYFATLKGAPAISILLALAVWHVLYRTKVHNYKALVFTVSAFLVLGAVWSQRIYSESLPDDIRPMSYCDAGKEMAAYARPDQVIFVQDARKDQHDFPLHPVFVYCAKRNIAIYKNKLEAEDLMSKNGVTSGVLFTLVYFGGSGSEIIDAKEITLSTR